MRRLILCFCIILGLLGLENSRCGGAGALHSFPQILDEHVRIELRGDLDVGVTEQLLHQPEVARLAQRAGGGGMAHVVDPGLHAGALRGVAPVRGETVDRDRVALAPDILALGLWIRLGSLRDEGEDGLRVMAAAGP